MKRFRSNLDGIHGVTRQQLRMVELELARLTIRVRGAEQQLQHSLARQQQAEQAMAGVLRQPGGTTTMQAALRQLEHSRQAVEAAREDLLQRRRELEPVRNAYRELESKEESLARLIERQRQEHRMHSIREQQHVRDEAAARRWSLENGI